MINQIWWYVLLLFHIYFISWNYISSLLFSWHDVDASTDKLIALFYELLNFLIQNNQYRRKMLLKRLKRARRNLRKRLELSWQIGRNDEDFRETRWQRNYHWCLLSYGRSTRYTAVGTKITRWHVQKKNENIIEKDNGNRATMENCSL